MVSLHCPKIYKPWKWSKSVKKKFTLTNFPAKGSSFLTMGTRVNQTEILICTIIYICYYWRLAKGVVSSHRPRTYKPWKYFECSGGDKSAKFYTDENFPLKVIVIIIIMWPAPGKGPFRIEIQLAITAKEVKISNFLVLSLSEVSRFWLHFDMLCLYICGTSPMVMG